MVVFACGCVCVFLIHVSFVIYNVICCERELLVRVSFFRWVVFCFEYSDPTLVVPVLLLRYS